MILEAALGEFSTLGYARLGRLPDDAALDEMRRRAERMMLGELVYDGLFFQKDSPTNRYDDLEYGKGWEGPSLDYRKIEKLELDPAYRAWISQPVFERVARALCDEGDGVTIYRAFLMNKSACGGSDLPWHQDGGNFWGLDRDPVLQIWTALDDAPVVAGCVEVLPGTHTAGLATPLGGVVPAQLVEARGTEDAVLLPVRAGEALLLHNHLWHRSGVNRSGRARRALSVCYMSARTRCVRKKRAPRTFFRVF
jgi:hypothetical protein